jgi:hypothetical protein
MAGFITKRAVLRYTTLIVRTWGIKVWWKCLVARRGVAFLSVIFPL